MNAFCSQKLTIFFYHEWESTATAAMTTALSTLEDTNFTMNTTTSATNLCSLVMNIGYQYYTVSANKKENPEKEGLDMARAKDPEVYIYI